MIHAKLYDSILMAQTALQDQQHIDKQASVARPLQSGSSHKQSSDRLLLGGNMIQHSEYAEALQQWVQLGLVLQHALARYSGSAEVSASLPSSNTAASGTAASVTGVNMPAWESGSSRSSPASLATQQHTAQPNELHEPLAQAAVTSVDRTACAQAAPADMGLGARRADPLAQLQEACNTCAGALRRLACDPRYAPRIALHHEQAKALQAWLVRRWCMTCKLALYRFPCGLARCYM